MQKLMNCGIKASQLRASRAAFSIRPDIDTHGTFQHVVRLLAWAANTTLDGGVNWLDLRFAATS